MKIYGITMKMRMEAMCFLGERKKSENFRQDEWNKFF